jgi:predicted metalloprotease with PDZ domain
LSFAARTLNVGGKNDEVVVVVAPSVVEWNGKGLQIGANGFWAVDSSGVDQPDNTWIHEYIHTRQEWSYDDSTQWLIEGMANYYAALLSLKEGRVSYSDFREYINTDEDSNSVLCNPDQWNSSTTSYTKGRRVVAALDIEIRRETDSQRSFENIFLEINKVGDTITHEKFKRIARDVAGHSIDAWLEKYVEDSRSPDLPE